MEAQGYERVALTPEEAADLTEMQNTAMHSAKRPGPRKDERMTRYLQSHGDLIERILQARGMKLGDREIQVSEDENGQVAMWMAPPKER
jgi:hypothetical protein